MSGRRVALNGRFSGTLQATGTHTTAFHLFDAIVRSPRTTELVIFADAEFPGVADWAVCSGVKLIQIPFSKWSRGRAQLWEQFAFAPAARKYGCTLAHHPITSCPRFMGGLRHIVTVHDLTFLHHPEWVGRNFRRWLMATAVPGIRAAAHVAAISDYVLQDVRTTLQLPVKRSSRIYNGVKLSSHLTPPASKPDRERAILGVNLWQPHKNLVRLLKAFAILRTELPDLQLQLVGRPQANFPKVAGLSPLTSAPGVKLLGYVSNEALATAYTQASVFAYPSLAEGFGLPVLEAMAAGTPVVTSNTTSLPEIARGAAILVNPLSETAITDGLRQALLENESGRATRIAHGKRIAQGFSWRTAAESYLQLYERLLSEP